MYPERSAQIERKTGETQITLSLTIDGKGRADIQTGIGFLDHMLTLFAGHGLFDLTVHATGDLHIDDHHTAEDVCICLGKALDQALGDRRGIVRTAHSYVPMDEALGLVAIDLGGRPYCVFDAEFVTPNLGQLGTDLLFHLFETLAIHGRLNLHAKVLYGRNDHHKAEALFKALGRALDAATQIDPRRQGVPSTKGTLIA
jgi:imidazoleglycerol-phosphate dehydratase